MFKLTKSITALLLSAVLVPGAYAAGDNDKQLASINGEPIMASQLVTYAKVKNPNADLSKPEISNQMMQAYVGRELLYQEAMTQKLDQLPLVKLAVENQRREVISQALIAKIMNESPVTDEQVHSFYDKKVAEGKADASKPKLPTYDQVSLQIRQALMQQKLAEYVQTLQKKAKIEVNK